MQAHSTELRQRAIDLVLRDDWPIARVAIDLQVSASTIRRWVRVAQYAQTGVGRQAPFRRPDPPYRRELSELRRRLLSLEREVELLRGPQRPAGTQRGTHRATQP